MSHRTAQNKPTIAGKKHKINLQLRRIGLNGRRGPSRARAILAWPLASRRLCSVTLAHPTEPRTEVDFDFKLCLWRFTFLNRTKPTKYEALEKNAFSRPIVPKIRNLQYSHNPRKPTFARGFSARSLTQKRERSGGWRREWDSNPRYGFPHTRFPSVRLKPLGHLSGWPVLKGPGDFCKGGRRGSGLF